MSDENINWIVYVCSECGFETKMEFPYERALCPNCESEMYTND